MENEWTRLTKRQKTIFGICMGIIIVVAIIVLLIPSKESTCPTQGTFQSLNSYCQQLCLINQTDADYNKRICRESCNTVKFFDGTPGLEEEIKFLKCENCGECSAEQNKTKIAP